VPHRIGSCWLVREHPLCVACISSVACVGFIGFIVMPEREAKRLKLADSSMHVIAAVSQDQGARPYMEDVTTSKQDCGNEAGFDCRFSAGADNPLPRA
jgi:hypothetical protein